MISGLDKASQFLGSPWVSSFIVQGQSTWPLFSSDTHFSSNTFLSPIFYVLFLPKLLAFQIFLFSVLTVSMVNAASMTHATVSLFCCLKISFII